LYAIYLKAKLDVFPVPRDQLLASQNLYSASIAIREALISSIKTHTVNGARCAALRLILQDCLRFGQVQGSTLDGIKCKEDGEETVLSDSEQLEEKMGELEVDMGKYEVGRARKSSTWGKRAS